MKYVKMLSLAAVAAIAAMAFVGASSASAATEEVSLCKAEETECAAANVYGAGTVLKAKSTNAILKGTLTEKCNESNTEAEITSAGGMATGSLLGTINALSFTGSCSPCTTVTVENLKYVWHLLHKTSPTLKWILDVLKPRAHLSGGLFCPSEGCTFEAENVELEAVGSNTAPELIATEAPIPLVAGPKSLCGEVGKWSANYIVSSPTPLWPRLTHLP